MISLSSKFRKPRPRQSELSRESRVVWSRRNRIIHSCATKPQPHSCGEGELHKKRTERGYLTGSGINTSQPKCDGLAPAFMGFLAVLLSGGKGAYAQDFTNVHGFGNEKEIRLFHQGKTRDVRSRKDWVCA